MMRFWIVSMILQILFLSACAYAQPVKIIDIKGTVQIKKQPGSDWQNVGVDFPLLAQYEVKTGKDSKCTVAFDDELKNILTIEENSHIRIKNIKPVDIFLAEGMVFSLIENIAEIEDLKIMTPDAISEVGGTGWGINYNHDFTSIYCFEDTVKVSGLDETGKLTERKDLFNGYGLNIEEGGVISEIFSLTNKDYQGWNNFINYLDGLLKKDIANIGISGESKDGDDGFGDIRGDFY